MPIPQSAATYKELENKVKNRLADALQMRKISIEEVMSILFVFGQTQTVDHLEAFIEIFSDIFPVIKSLQLEQTEGTKRNIEDVVKKAVSKILLKDPFRAAQLAKDSIDKNITREQLMGKYPELQEE